MRGQASVRYAITPCTLGLALVAIRGDHICAVELGERPDDLVASLAKRFPDSSLESIEPASEPLVARCRAALESSSSADALPLDAGGTSFQRLVWSQLRSIPRGETRTYGQVAHAIGRPTASRAVAAACASNRLAVVIPCHRVVCSDGSISGYRWGVERKRLLLARERALGQ